VEHRLVTHAAITSVQEALEKGVPDQLGVQLGNVIKNLLVRDSAHHLFLLVTPGMKRVNLRKVAATLGVSHLSMARLDEAQGIFGAHKGAVSLFDLLKMSSTSEISVEAIVDKSITAIDGDVAFPAGAANRSVVIAAQDVEKVATAIGETSGQTTRTETIDAAQW
jgi:prolyl-tRNA editing enzyme YbaK/EbsC (Cys-tRNA(Pro) deacylase)